jgi:hypothetical protein
MQASKRAAPCCHMPGAVLLRGCCLPVVARTSQHSTLHKGRTTASLELFAVGRRKASLKHCTQCCNRHAMQWVPCRATCRCNAAAMYARESQHISVSIRKEKVWLRLLWQLHIFSSIQEAAQRSSSNTLGVHEQLMSDAGELSSYTGISGSPLFEQLVSLRQCNSSGSLPVDV